MKVVFLTWTDSFFVNQLRNLKLFHERRGDKVTFVNFHSSEAKRVLNGAEQVYIWNGAYGGNDGDVIHYAESVASNVTYCEIAWFPQSKFLYFDSEGTNGNSSLFDDPLDWLEEDDFRAAENLGVQYRDGRELTDDGYILVPLQLPGDQQILRWSPYRWMGSFIRDTREKFNGRKLIFRRHPKDKKRYEDLNIGHEGEGNLKDLICGADMVYGINSTVLLEAALMGKEVESIGKCLLNIGPSRNHALAALVARQVPSDARDFTPWMRPGRGLEHLAR